MKILLAVDGSLHQEDAGLPDHARSAGHGRPSNTPRDRAVALPPRARAALGKQIVDEYYADEAAKVLNPVCKFLARHGVVPTQLSKVGVAGEVIAKVAESGKFDLVVMGSTATALAGQPGDGFGQHPGAGARCR
jgi:nucleotide-binding universal stress UspA family protein